jgi:ParB family chromosome partitioning protein
MIEQFSKLFGIQDKQSHEEIKLIATDLLISNPFQPRTVFDETKIIELAQSIEMNGMIQPIIVRESGQYYEIVAGERRWRAAKHIGLDQVPVIVRVMDDNQTATIALIENLQRENLTAIEEATAYQQLISLQAITQESLAEQLGKSQSSVANKMRLLQLDDSTKEAIYHRKISERHARSLLKLNNSEMQRKLLLECIEKDYSVKQLETRIKYYLEENNIQKTRKISYTKDVRLALNTIRQSIAMIRTNNLNIVSDESDHDEFIEINIKIFKQK